MKRLAAAIALAVGLLVSLPRTAHARSFEITDMVVEANVRPDGAMDVVEHLTYSFDGDFFGGDRSIPPGDYYDVVDMRVDENGEPQVILDADPSSFSWDSPHAPISGVHTWNIHYTVVGAVQVGPDVGELFWKFIGDDFPGVGHLDVTITFPPGSGDLLAWAHGPLTGTVQPSGNVVTLEVGDVPEGQFVEAHIAASSDRFTVAPSGEPRLQDIKDYEEKLRRDTERHKRNIRIANYASPAALVGGVVAFVVIWRKWGKEPDPPADIGDYFREVPAESPAVIQAFEAWGAVPRAAFSSTVVDLAQRGYLTITEEVHERFGPDKTEYTFRSGKGVDDALKPYERKVLFKLFESGPTVTQSELVKAAARHRTESASWWNSFAGMVKTDLKSQHFFNEKGRFRPFCLHFVLILVLGIAGVVMIAAGAGPGGVVCFVTAVLLMLLTGLLRQRTPEGARKLAEVRGLRKFLKDFSRLDEAVSGDMILYERYLVYAVALGVSKELMEGLQVRMPELATQPSFAPWYIGHSMGPSRFDSLGSIGSFASSFTSSTAGAFSPPASSGGGGGFSGGGGGGGGGGGAGAH